MRNKTPDVNWDSSTKEDHFDQRLSLYVKATDKFYPMYLQYPNLFFCYPYVLATSTHKM